MAFDQAHLNVLNSYLSTGIHTVKGWCIPQLWQSIWPLACMIGPGPVAEIGVFEGKFLIGLVKTFDDGTPTLHSAIDVFDMQQFNIDGAGVGKVDVLDNNLDRLGVGMDRVAKLRADSLALRPRDAEALVSRHGPFAFFSVDGCHEVTHTVSDIEFAMSCTSAEGIISVDDYNNIDWPGVNEAVAKMYLLRTFSFVPLLVTCNKLLLCSYSYHASYLNAVRDYVAAHHPTTKVKEVVRFGYRTLSVKTDTTKWSDLAFPAPPRAKPDRPPVSKFPVSG